jgi:hypothetical protein
MPNRLVLPLMLAFVAGLMTTPYGLAATDLTLSAPGDESSSSQEQGPPLSSLDMLQKMYNVCTDVASGDPEAYDRANGDGWSSDGDEGSGPLKTVYSAYKNYDGFDQVTLWSSVETYPTQRLGYCSVDFSEVGGTINLNDMSKIGGLAGKVVDNDAGTYGSWESADHKVLVVASRSDGAVEVEFNLLLGPAPGNG